MTVTRIKGTVPSNMVINNITIRQINRKTQDIDKWRQAIRSFENIVNPVRLWLYDLYEDIILDGQIEATWGKRLDYVQNKKLIYINKDKQQDEEINKLLNSSDLRVIRKELLKSIAWGFTTIQINSVLYDDMQECWKIDYDLIPRKHVHPERNFQCISKDQSVASKDFMFMEDPLQKYMLWAGDPQDKGLLCIAAQYVIYKRGGFGDWSQFAEMFGMPFREASYEDYDDATRLKLEEAMEKWGSANYLIRPKGAELKIHDTASSSGSNTLYKDLVGACNAEISKIFLGNTLTTDQGDKGARSLGEVHSDAEKQKHMNDENFILEILNTKFRAILKIFGIDCIGGAILFQDDEADWAKMLQKWQVYAGIAQTVPVSDDTIYEEFNIPKPDNYDQLKNEMQQKQALNDFSKAFKQDPNNPDNAPKNFFGVLRNFFV